MTPITSLWPCHGQGVDLVTQHNYGPRPGVVTLVGGGQRRTPWAPAVARGGAEEGEGEAAFETPDANHGDGADEEIQLTPPLPSPTRSPRRGPPASPAPSNSLRRSRRAAAADANAQLDSEYADI